MGVASDLFKRLYQTVVFHETLNIPTAQRGNKKETKKKGSLTKQ